MGGVTHRWRWKSESISRNEERKGEEILTLILKSPNSRIELDSKEIQEIKDYIFITLQ